MTLQFMRKAGASFFDLKLAYLAQSVPLTLLTLFCAWRAVGNVPLRLFLAVASVLALVVVLRSNEFNYQVYLVPYAIAAVGLTAANAGWFYRYLVPLGLYGFFAVVLFSKAAKYGYRTDDQYEELISHLDAHPTWTGKRIYVAGGPDVASHLMEQGGDVERSIPVPIDKPSNWADKYTCVVEVVDRGGSDEKPVADTVAPWQTWRKTEFTTSKGLHTLTVYER